VIKNVGEVESWYSQKGKGKKNGGSDVARCYRAGNKEGERGSDLK